MESNLDLKREKMICKKKKKSFPLIASSNTKQRKPISFNTVIANLELLFYTIDLLA